MKDADACRVLKILFLSGLQQEQGGHRRDTRSIVLLGQGYVL
ncbi:hypothetical protein ES703_105738 [subsurface metagenome]